MLTDLGWRATLQRLNRPTMFGNDLETIVVDVEFYSESMVRIKVGGETFGTYLKLGAIKKYSCLCSGWVGRGRNPPQPTRGTKGALDSLNLRPNSRFILQHFSK